MTSPGEILREIHRLRRNAKELEGKSEAGPKQLKMQHAAVTRQEENLRQAQEQLKHLKVKTHEKEVSLKTCAGQIAKYEKQLNDIMSKKEYEALKHEMTNSRAEKDKLEDEILALLEQIDQQQAKVPECEKALAQARAQAAQFEQDYEARMADLAAQRRQALARLAEVEAGLPDDIRSQYDRLVGHKGQDAMAAVENSTCVACYTSITAQSQNDLLRGMFVLCKSCGRMLYLAE